MIALPVSIEACHRRLGDERRDACRHRVKNTVFTRFFHVIVATYILFFTHAELNAENIDPSNSGFQYLYAENVGWLNAKPQIGSGVHVSGSKLTGYIWGENIGWINLSPAGSIGVSNDGNGNLSGYAWGENVGWINFAPTFGGVNIDPHTGVFSGYAWGENIGWIALNSAKHRIATSWNEFPWNLFYPVLIKKKTN